MMIVYDDADDDVDDDADDDDNTGYVCPGWGGIEG